MRLVAWLLYAIFEIILQILFQIWLCIGQEILFCLELIQFSHESTNSILQHIWVSKHNFTHVGSNVSQFSKLISCNQW